MQEILDIFRSEILESEAVSKLQSLTVSSLQYLKFLGILVLGILLISSFSRFLFGKKAQVTQAIASAIEIFFVYVITIVVYALGLQLPFPLVPLPFVALAEDYLVIFPILTADFPSICDQTLKLLIIAFLVNLAGGLIPRGEHPIPWFFLRLLTVVLSVALIYGAEYLLHIYIPQGLGAYAPMILLCVLAALILLGSLKLLVGGLIAFLDPIMAALYTFFFANVVGRALAKAILTTGLIMGLLAALNYLEIYAVHIAASVLKAYIPLLLIVLVLWYVVGHLFTKED